MRFAILLLVIVGAVALSVCDNPPAPTPVTTTTTTLPPTTTTLAVKTCTLAPMPDCGPSGCCRDGGERLFDFEIREAQEALREARPEWFKSNGAIKVEDAVYTQGVAEKVTELFGLCARGGAKFHHETSISPDEVAIKRDNHLSQNVDIIIGASQQPQRGEHSTCRPASF